jgi:cysteinyl-tRNA synthetase
MDSKDFSKLDALKEQLVEAGVVVKMSKEGVEMSQGPNFDASKMVGLA